MSTYYEEDNIEMSELDAETGQTYDQEMADIIADAAEKECESICQDVQNEVDAEYEYLESLAAIRYAEQNYNPGQEI
jgi:hypothetical protein